MNYLGFTELNDYSNYVEGRSCNGGQYARYVETHFLQVGNEFFLLELTQFSSEFPTDSWGNYGSGDLNRYQILYPASMPIACPSEVSYWEHVDMRDDPAPRQLDWRQVWTPCTREVFLSARSAQIHSAFDENGYHHGNSHLEVFPELLPSQEAELLVAVGDVF